MLEAQVLDITGELRCLVCQNQTIADSHADLAVDLRRQVREMLRRGESREQIVAYMTARYGDFVLYRPPLKPTTFLLWFGPAAAGRWLAVLILVLRRRARLPVGDFEPDDDDALDGVAGTDLPPRELHDGQRSGPTTPARTVAGAARHRRDRQGQVRQVARALESASSWT